MKSLFLRCISAVTASVIAGTSLCASAQQKTPPQTRSATPARDDIEPKPVWGILVNVILSRVGMALLDWAVGKLTNKLDSVTFSTLTKKSEVITLEAPTPVTTAGGQPLGLQENVVAGEPSKEFKLENGRENFQGMVVSMAVFDTQGKPIGFRPINEPFKTGEKFKLRVLSTFESHFYVDAINPNGVRNKLFPSATNTLRIPAGAEVLVPADQNQFFQFHGTTGKERLVIVMRDVKLESANLPIEPVYRKDESFGSLFVQEVTGSKRPLIVQSIALIHK